MKKTKTKKAVWIGRFQPFHLGHFFVLEGALEQYEVINIVIGSSQEDYTERNPLTASERKKMIKSVLDYLRVKSNRYRIILAPDIPTNSLWADYVSHKVGRFDEVITASSLTKLLFEDSGYRVNAHGLFKRRFYSGTEVRKRILRGGNWGYLIPIPVRTYLYKIGIERRIKEVLASDNPYN